ncbi:MATE family efflux transporter [Paenibacillus antri]|uniref:Probable multidrug resistance protein NorM n=1 Tax=Paenibacillus antri TaxID=2582848 RepID=A0A5R9GD53_9BACL|nr:MATE family efflux transporter [Paenibacillus antri]TLS51104.1 MATE family efflux transporter [Paenibacillus antri]
MRYWKTILSLALPSILSFATMTASGTINLILVGKMGALVIAIVGVCNIIMYNAWALFSGLGHTINYLVAQSYGAERMDQGVMRTYIALLVSAVMGAAVFVVGLFASGPILAMMGGDAAFVAEGTPYLRLRFAAMAFSIPIFVFHGFLRGVGDTRTPMILTILGNAVMVVLTYGLAFGEFGLPTLGLAGAGWGMVAGEAVGLLGCLYVYYVRMAGRFGTRRRVRPSLSETKLIAAESGKLGLQEFAMSVSMLVFTRFVMELGTTAVAANEVALNVMSFGFMPAFAFGATATILVGQEIGRGAPELARKLGTHTALLGSLFLLALGAVEFAFAESIARWYTDDPEVYRLTAHLIQVAAFLQLFDGFYNFFGGGLRGIGDTAYLLKASVALNWLLFLPVAYLAVFVFEWGSYGAWVSLYLYMTAFGLALMLRYYRTDWSQIRLKETAGSPSN